MARSFTFHTRISFRGCSEAFIIIVVVFFSLPRTFVSFIKRRSGARENKIRISRRRLWTVGGVEVNAGSKRERKKKKRNKKKSIHMRVCVITTLYKTYDPSDRAGRLSPSRHRVHNIVTHIIRANSDLWHIVYWITLHTGSSVAADADFFFFFAGGTHTMIIVIAII